MVTLTSALATASGMATAAAPAMHVGDGVARRAAHHARRAEETRLAEGEPAHNGGEVARGEPAQVADAISSTSFVSALVFGFAVSTFAGVLSTADEDWSSRLGRIGFCVCMAVFVLAGIATVYLSLLIITERGLLAAPAPRHRATARLTSSGGASTRTVSP